VLKVEPPRPEKPEFSCAIAGTPLHGSEASAHP
jgi:hypothetical protein